MSPTLDNLATVHYHYQDQICSQDSAQAVRSDNARPANHDPLEGFLNECLRFRYPMNWWLHQAL